jgi:hypothetical protein
MINERPINFNLHFSISSSSTFPPNLAGSFFSNAGAGEHLIVCWKLLEFHVQTIGLELEASEGTQRRCI